MVALIVYAPRHIIFSIAYKQNYYLLDWLSSYIMAQLTRFKLGQSIHLSL